MRFPRTPFSFKTPLCKGRCPAPARLRDCSFLPALCYAATLSCLRRVTFFHQRSPTRYARMCALCQPKIHRRRLVFLGQKRKSHQRSAARNRWFLDQLRATHSHALHQPKIHRLWLVFLGCRGSFILQEALCKTGQNVALSLLLFSLPHRSEM